MEGNELGIDNLRYLREKRVGTEDGRRIKEKRI